MLIASASLYIKNCLENWLFSIAKWTWCLRDNLNVRKGRHYSLVGTSYPRRSYQWRLLFPWAFVIHELDHLKSNWIFFRNQLLNVFRAIASSFFSFTKLDHHSFGGGEELLVWRSVESDPSSGHWLQGCLYREPLNKRWSWSERYWKECVRAVSIPVTIMSICRQATFVQNV